MALETNTLSGLRWLKSKCVYQKESKTLNDEVKAWK